MAHVKGSASERLLRLNDQIMKTWEVRANAEVEAAGQQNSLVLRNSLPEFLDFLAKTLAITVDRSEVRTRWDRDETKRVGRKHGRERAQTEDYTMDQLIFEYHILRQVICNTLEEEAPLTDIEREVIICGVEQAVNDAATEFNESFAAVHQRVTDTLAHDLRGPITAAKMSAQLIVKKKDDLAHCAKLGSRISKAMDRLDIMIHDLLDASRLRAGEKLELVFDDCDLNSILLEVAEEMNFVHGNRIRLETTENGKGHWNEKGLRRVIDNLVSNALKFAVAGSPVDLKLKRLEKTIEISVHNLGNPISDAETLDLFKQFRRSRTSQGKVGWGLGLTVVKGITTAHGGSIDVESSEQAGTTFTVTLPLNAAILQK